MRKIFIALLLGLAMIQPGCVGKQSQNPQTTNQSQTNTANEKVFTLDELKKYNGQNGNSAYVAVDGIVYDVTNAKRWRNGNHENCAAAGSDLSNAIKSSPHGKNVLSNLPVVGKLKQ